MKERKDRVDDALHATRSRSKKASSPAAYRVLYAPRRLEGRRASTKPDPRHRHHRRALQAPVRQIAKRRFDGGVVAGKLFDQNDSNFGFNASTDVYEDLVKAGVIDPTKVVRIALQDAASVAGLLITTEAGIAESPDDKPAMPMGGGGMGGMGGMDF